MRTKDLFTQRAGPRAVCRLNPWSADRARAWLAFLAAHLHRRGTRDLAWWELAPGRAASQIARALGLGLAVGILVGLPAVQALGQAPNHSIDLPSEIQRWIIVVVWTALGAAIAVEVERSRSRRAALAVARRPPLRPIIPAATSGRRHHRRPN